MCGIIGVTGEADAVPLLIGALHQLEYRGYDSAGIAVVVDDGGGATPSGGSGPPAAPTRWPSWPSWRPTPPGATGPPSGTPGGPPTAAPPRRTPTRTLDCTGRLAIVHNGIIENHAELRAELVAAGHTLTSATDTEVMAHLIEQEMAGGASLAEATRTMLRRLRGAFSIAVVCRRRARHHRRRPPPHAARARAARPRGPPGLGHPRPDRAHAPRLRVGRRRAGRPAAGLARGHHVGRHPGRAGAAHHHLGPRGGPEGRLRGLHVQGDAGAAACGGRHAARPAGARRASSCSTRCVSGSRTCAASTRCSSWRAGPATTPRWWPSTPLSTGSSCRSRSTSPASSATGTRS